MKKIVFVAVSALASAVLSAEDSAIITLQTSKASAVVSLYGGQVISFKTHGEEVLWSPKIWNHGGRKWNHGGIPVCWPWFGRGGPVTNVIHGFARNYKFTVRGRKNTPERAELVLGLTSAQATHEAWPYGYDLEYTIVLTDVLDLKLVTKNTGSARFSFTAGFHPYFFIGDRDRTTVTGTDGMRYCDARQSTTCDGVWKGNMKLTSSFDHVFAEPYPTALHKILDPVLDRTISVRSSGAKNLVVWNPGSEEPVPEKPGPGDLAVGDWRHFVCVEPAFLWKDSTVHLNPGETYELTTEISLAKGAGK